MNLVLRDILVTSHEEQTSQQHDIANRYVPTLLHNKSGFHISFYFKICTDIDECQRRRSCDNNAVCTNTIVRFSSLMVGNISQYTLIIIQGSYTCTCKPYYKGDGKTCAVDNACEVGKHNCGSKDWCSSLGDGKFTCAVSSSVYFHVTR